MSYEWSVHPYQRNFVKPYVYGERVLNTREGLLLKIESSTPLYAEIAPLPGFASESLAAARNYLNSLPAQLDEGCLLDTPEALPLTQFALQSLHYQLTHEVELAGVYPVSTLVDSIEQLKARQQGQYKHFKVKVNARTSHEELTEYLRVLGDADTLRLDANGTLSAEGTIALLRFLNDYPQVVYLEQPLPVGEEALMAELAKNYPTPLALDESVAHAEDLYRFAYSYPHLLLVVKLPLLGDLYTFLDLQKSLAPSLIYSSFLETPYGERFSLYLTSLFPSVFPLGFATQRVFEEDVFTVPLLPPEVNLADYSKVLPS